MTKALLCLVVACAACQMLGSAQSKGEIAYGSLTLQSPDSPMARAILPLMHTWRAAVLNQDKAGLVRVALPEAREGIGEALEDKSSPLWKSLFAGSRSFRAFLEDPSTRIAVFEHHLILGSHYQVTACFFRDELQWPTNYLALQELVKRRTVRCLDWVFGEEGEWFVSYGFGMPERVPRR